MGGWVRAINGKVHYFVLFETVPYMPACCPGKKLDQRTSLGMSYIKVLGLFECSLRGVSEVLNLYVFIFCIFKAE